MSETLNVKEAAAVAGVAPCSADWQPNPEDRRYVECVVSMALDILQGRGVKNRETFIANLRSIAKCLEITSPPNDKISRRADSEHGRQKGHND